MQNVCGAGAVSGSSLWLFLQHQCAVPVFNSLQRAFKIPGVFFFFSTFLSIWKKFFQKVASNVLHLVVSLGLSGELSPPLYGLNALLAFITPDMRRERT